MFKLKSTNTIKGMIFAGCSFTWGQGLYYYSNLPTLAEPRPGLYDADLVRFSHYEYLKTVRYPRLVANHFNKFEICQPFNGGTTNSIIEWWNNCFSNTVDRNKSLNGNWEEPKYDFSDFSHIVYQFTQWTRSYDTVISSPESKIKNIDMMQSESFNELLKNNQLTMDMYIDRAIQSDIEYVKSFLKKFEDNGVKAYVLSWPFDLIPYILKDSWLSKRLVNFEHKGVQYSNIEQMIGTSDSKWYEVPNPELTIQRDINAFEITPFDWHPSLTCHRVIADSIIKHIEQNEQT